MSVLHRLLAGVEFSITPESGEIRWPAPTEDLLRTACELRRIVRGELALAAVGIAPQPCDCASADRWMTSAEESLQALWQSVANDEPVEIGAWLGSPDEEWTASARESSMDLLLVPHPGSESSLFSVRLDSEGAESRISLVAQAGCPVWYLGTEHDHQLGSEPPLIAVVDDLSSQAERYLPLAIELAQAWNARLIVTHPLGHPESDLSEERSDSLRREIFIRLSKTDFRSLPWGSQFRFLESSCEPLLRGELTGQTPNLVLGSTRILTEAPSNATCHRIVWS